MKFLRSAFFLVAVLSVSVLGARTASAASLIFKEIGDTVYVQHDAFFECGITSSTNGEDATVDACWITNSPNGFSGTGICYMVEPQCETDPGSAGAISDKIAVQFDVAGSLAHMHVVFHSDADNLPHEFPDANWPTVIVEDGTVQPLNGHFVNPATGQIIDIPANIIIYAQSDGCDAPVPVHPSTWGAVKALYR